MSYALLNRVDKFLGETGRTAGVIAGAGVAAALIRLLLDLASRLHWFIAALLAFILACAAVWLTRQVKKARAAKPSDVLAVLALGLLTLAVVGAWLSFTLYQTHLASYAVPAAVSIGTFLDLYMYTFFDLIPAIDVWETLHVTPPIEAHGPVAGLPLLAFKVFVVWVLFDAFFFWLTKRTVSSTRSESAPAAQDG